MEGEGHIVSCSSKIRVKVDLFHISNKELFSGDVPANRPGGGRGGLRQEIQLISFYPLYFA